MRCPNGCIAIVVLFMCLVTVFIAHCGESPPDVEVTPEEISAAIPSDLEHPYLFFTTREKPALLDRIENDRECRDIMNRMLETSGESPRYHRGAVSGRGTIRQLLCRSPHVPEEDAGAPRRHSRFSTR